MNSHALDLSSNKSNQPVQPQNPPAPEMHPSINECIMAFMGILNTLPIIPVKLVQQISHKRATEPYKTFFLYILCVGSTLLVGVNRTNSNIADDDLQQENHFINIHFNLVKVVYYRFRGLDQQAKGYCEKAFTAINDFSKAKPLHGYTKTMVWAYSLVSWSLKNLGNEYAFDLNTYQIPKEWITGEAAEMSRGEQKETLKQDAASIQLIEDDRERQKEARYYAFFLQEHILSLKARLPIYQLHTVSLHDIQLYRYTLLQFSEVTSSLPISDRLLMFSSEVEHLRTLTTIFRLYPGPTLCSQLLNLLSLASAFNKSYTSNGDYDNAFQEMNSEMLALNCPQFCCEKCFPPVPFDSSVGMQRHQRKDHPLEESAIFTCECSVTFQTPGGLYRHRLEKHGTPVNHQRKDHPLEESAIFTCECSVTFQTPGGLYRHRLEKHGTPVKRKTRNKGSFRCNGCGATFSYIPDLIKHLKDTHMIRRLRSVGCIPCNIDFNALTKLSQHHKDTHIGIKPKHGKTLICSADGVGNEQF